MSPNRCQWKDSEWRVSPYLLWNSSSGSSSTLRVPPCLPSILHLCATLEIPHCVTCSWLWILMFGCGSPRASWLSDPKFSGLEDAVEDSTVEIPVYLLHTKFLTGLDLAQSSLRNHLLATSSTWYESSIESWKGWCKTKTEGGSIHHMLSFLWSKCLRVDFWSRRIWFGSWGPINSIKQPIKSNSVSSGNMSQCRTSAFDDHLDHSLVVFKDVQHGSLMRRIRVWGNKIDIGQFKMSLRNWNVGMRIQLFLNVLLRDGSLRACLSFCFWFEFACITSTVKSQRSSAGIPSIRKPASREIIFRLCWCLLNHCNVVAQLVTSQPVTVDTTVTFIPFTDVLSSSRIMQKQLASSIVHSALAPVLRRFPLLHGSGGGYPGIVVLIYSWYWDIAWWWHLLKKLRCWDVTSMS